MEWNHTAMFHLENATSFSNSSEHHSNRSGDGGQLGTITTAGNCPSEIAEDHSSSLFGISLAVPEWEVVLTALTLSAIIFLTIIGNILVILSVFTYKPLRIVQNFFIVSLAVADLTVAILVLPLNVAYSLLRRWEFGIHVCKLWLTCDVLCCTASILNLCAIALDRYWAITDPINYAQKRSVRRVLLLIAGVWVLSLLISSPPLLGWNDWPDEFHTDTPCQLTSQQGYVIYSSLGSFYIPLFIMMVVYMKIYLATKRRLRERARASKLNTVKQTVIVTAPSQEPGPRKSSDGEDSNSSDDATAAAVTDHNQQVTASSKKKKRRKGSVERARKEMNNSPNHMIKNSALDLLKTNYHEDGTSVVAKTSLRIENDNANPSPAKLPCSFIDTAKRGAVYQFIEEKQRISLSKERRAARTLGIIMGVFVVCWLPFFLMYVILPFCPSCCPSERLINFITWLGYINSALNPIIYTIFNLDFRRAFKKLLHLKP